MFICCACLFGIGSPEQFLIVKHAKGGEMLGGCCIQGAFNLGNAMGAFLGGIPVAMGLGYNFPALIGVPMALAGAICLLIFHKKDVYKRQIQHSLWILIFIDFQKCRHGLFAHACTFVFYTIKSLSLIHI